MPVFVPDTNTFSLQHVFNAVNDHASPREDLMDCFAYAVSYYFDANYDNDSYAPANSLKRFRNYGPAGYDILVPEGFSPNEDGVHDYFEVENLQHHPVHKMSIFFSPGGTLIYTRTNDYHTYPWDGKYQGAYVASTTYYWVLEVDGEVYDTGYVFVAY